MTGIRLIFLLLDILLTVQCCYSDESPHRGDVLNKISRISLGNSRLNYYTMYIFEITQIRCYESSYNATDHYDNNAVFCLTGCIAYIFKKYFFF